ncbi:recombinase family protein [Anaerovibrio sp.]|uniref:recombinase family protein n=1 Tax=Anaerovibrio sp. TaxID=1872532 RepID=UPI003F16E1C8
MKSVKVISQTKFREGVRLRVAAYCRVSTSQSEQLDSLENQRIHYQNYIRSNSEWQYAGIYYDEGITGTSISRRGGFCRMMQDARKGRIDLIIVKSVSRFARNTVDCLESIRELARHQVYIIFEQEQICTRQLEDEFLLTIFSALAENESVSISDNVKWGIRQSFRRGTYRSSISPYGYKIKNGVLMVQPEEAVVVQEIFSLAAAGCGPYIITNTINSRGFRTRKGKRWHVNSIKFILRNEKYTGDALYQKSFNDGSYQNRPNSGELPMYYHRNHHKAIISREIFFRTQLEYQKRAVKLNTVGKDVKAGRY